MNLLKIILFISFFSGLQVLEILKVEGAAPFLIDVFLIYIYIYIYKSYIAMENENKRVFLENRILALMNIIIYSIKFHTMYFPHYLIRRNRFILVFRWTNLAAKVTLIHTIFYPVPLLLSHDGSSYLGKSFENEFHTIKKKDTLDIK